MVGVCQESEGGTRERSGKPGGAGGKELRLKGNKVSITSFSSVNNP
jgi:hypothetical protein